MSSVRAILAAAAALPVVAISCSSTEQLADAGRSTTPPGSSLASVTATPSSTAAGVQDVDPARYMVETGYYRWSIVGSPERICAVSPSGQPTPNLQCSVAFPSSTPPVSNGPFSGAPNAIQVVPGQGWKPTISEGGRPGVEELEPGWRIRIAGIECTALGEGGFDCATPDAGFTFRDGTLDTRGRAAERTVPTSRVGVPMELPYDGSRPVGPGTACGASTGDIVVDVVSGTIACDEAIATIKRYRAMPEDPAAGNRQFREFDGWYCSSPTAAAAAELKYSTVCEKTSEGIRIVTPI